jgi:LacI family transcriptional regulator
MAADAFLESGFRQFAFFGYRGVCWSDGRRAGFQQRLEESGLAESFDSGDRIRGENFFWNFDQPRVWKWLVSLPKPVGIMASDDTQATLLIETCNNYGIRVPYDVAIIGVDNDEVACNLSQPAISSIDVDMERGGYQVAKMITKMVKDPTYPGEDVVMQPIKLVLRRSSNAVATTDTAVHAALEFIHDNLRHKIQVRDVLKSVPLSRRLLEQRFLSATGVSVYQYIMRKRIQYFSDLLLSSDDSIANLAAQMDEPDAKTLTRRFQAIMKCTPSEYRAAHLRKLR